MEETAPAADRSLPMAAEEGVRARVLVPVVVLAGVCGLPALLVGQGTGYRPDLDWSGPVLSSPMGAVPVGVSATLVRGPDVGVLGTAPVALALLLGTVPPVLVAVQLGWAVVLAAFAVLTAQTRP
ncbi:hypothetical protein [Modestobacter excelsi]|uniref:hypothetical protein n=1 Tax=Modestobacter excelsi TaxID=2213161 RepID=UPI00110CFA11|nr:hypothetical protein [Modestobacter excelsi]